MSNTESNSPSPRVNAARPVSRPMAMAHRRAGADFHSNAAQTVAVVHRAIKPSGNSTPSMIQRFGYTAANNIATNATRSRISGRATWRATKPTKTTTAVPMTRENILWSKKVVPPKRDPNESTNG